MTDPFRLNRHILEVVAPELEAVREMLGQGVVVTVEGNAARLQDGSSYTISPHLTVLEGDLVQTIRQGGYRLITDVLNRNALAVETVEGTGLPDGGTTGQVLTKASDDDGDADWEDATGGDVAAHLADTTDAHDASAVSFSPASGIAATDVQAAIVELVADVAAGYQPLDSDLTAIAALTTTSFGRALLALADAAALRTAGGLGTASTLASDTDTALAANSDARLATQKATKAYVDAAVIGLLEFKGSTDCSANPNYPAASKGDAYVVTVAGKIGGASGAAVDVGDVYVASADNAGGTQASVGTSWFLLEHNMAGALLAANNLSDLANASTARTNLGLAIGTNVQAFDADLAAIAALPSAADKVPYATGTGAWALADLTAAARTVLDDTTVAAMLATLLGAPLASPTFTGRITHAGFQAFGGTSFPASPASGDKFYRTDIGMEFRYDGTRWLSTQLFTDPIAVTESLMPWTATATGGRIGVPFVSVYDLWLVDFQMTFYIDNGTALSASHKWVTTLTGFTINTATPGTMATATIQSGIVNAFRVVTPVAIGALLSSFGVAGAAVVNFQVNHTKTGTPGGLYALPRISYRVVAT